MTNIYMLKDNHDIWFMHFLFKNKDYFSKYV